MSLRVWSCKLVRLAPRGDTATIGSGLLAEAVTAVLTAAASRGPSTMIRSAPFLSASMAVGVSPYRWVLLS